ncbi:MAG: thermonuclease family protein [Oscillatoriales cyanobacterium RM2_1_1]|nr:thermonuclease family protein [Oscillatoriales cyanobacterium SM2_3_0]NJO46293.1 thermonuclease family protein [Oscillatoriales cyanobacterium RM2_1_1]
MGTRVGNLQVTRVIDGDTIKVLLNGQQEFLRLHCVDTEESFSNGTKPVTDVGIASTEMAKRYFSDSNGNLSQVDLEFDGNELLEICLEKYRDGYGRLICYVHRDGENYNLKTIREGWSPYFIKYGRSQEYHQQMMQAEAEAQAHQRMIWHPDNHHHHGIGRNYELLMPWWSLRDSITQDYHLNGIPAGVFSVRLDYPKILEAAVAEAWVTIFCDLQDGITKWIGSGALIHTGSKDHIVKLWVPEAKLEKNAGLVHLIQRRYAGLGRGYAYVSGYVVMYRDKPEITLTDLRQISDFCPKQVELSSTQSISPLPAPRC